MRMLHVAQLSLLGVLCACGGGGAESASPATPSSATSTPSAGATGTKSGPDSDKVTWKKDSPAKTCHTGAKGDADLTAGVTAMATGCVGGALHQSGTPITGEGQEGTATMVKQIPLAAKANHCYRVFGLAQPTVTDFDIAITDSAGKSAGEDLTDANDAIVLEDGAICFKQDDNASVNVAVAKGQGKWAVEIWSN